MYSGALLAEDYNDVHREDFFSSLPEEVQEEINEHQDEFQSEEEMREYAHTLMKRS